MITQDHLCDVCNRAPRKEICCCQDCKQEVMINSYKLGIEEGKRQSSNNKQNHEII